jgi:hypothetical protein
MVQVLCRTRRTRNTARYFILRSRDPRRRHICHSQCTGRRTVRNSGTKRATGRSLTLRARSRVHSGNRIFLRAWARTNSLCCSCLYKAFTKFALNASKILAFLIFCRVYDLVTQAVGLGCCPIQDQQVKVREGASMKDAEDIDIVVDQGVA